MDHGKIAQDNGASPAGDCGCGCTGGCAEKPKGLLHGRRKVLAGSIGISAFAATLASRPAYAAACNNLTALYSPHPSASHIPVCSTGKTPGFWQNHAGCWPAGISPSDTFSKWFGSFTFPESTETLYVALSPPNGPDNLADQIAAGLLNAESPNTNGSFGYGSAQAFANAVIAAYNAVQSWSVIHDTIAAMNADSGNSNAWCSPQKISP